MPSWTFASWAHVKVKGQCIENMNFRIYGNKMILKTSITFILTNNCTANVLIMYVSILLFKENIIWTIQRTKNIAVILHQNLQKVEIIKNSIILAVFQCLHTIDIERKYNQRHSLKLLLYCNTNIRKNSF